MLQVEDARFQVLDLMGEKLYNRFVVAGFTEGVENLDHMVEFSWDIGLFFILLTLFILLVLLILLVSMKEFFDLIHQGRHDVWEQGI